jgi:hypothetical protein
MQLILQYVECEHCGEWFTHTNLLSYTFNGKVNLRSDGKYYGDEIYFSMQFPFTKCRKCGNFFFPQKSLLVPNFWLNMPENELNKEQKQILAAFYKKYPKTNLKNFEIPSLDYPPPEYWFNFPILMIKDALNVLEIPINQAIEIDIRIKLWQLFNDLKYTSENLILKHFFKNFSINGIFHLKFLKNHLNKKNKNIRFFYENKNSYISNLKRLSELLIVENKEKNLCFLVEIERNLGNFSKARTLLNEFSEHQKKEFFIFVKKTKRKLFFKSKKVFIL